MPNAPSEYPRWYDYFHPIFRRARGGDFSRSRGRFQGCGYGPAVHAHHWLQRYLPPWATTSDHLTALCRPCHRVMTLLRRFLSVGGDAGRFLAIVEAALAEAWGVGSPDGARAAPARRVRRACRRPDASARWRASDVVAEGVGALLEPRGRRATCRLRQRSKRIRRASIERTAGMRVKLLRDEDGATVRLVYPSTLAQYGEAFETLGALAVPAGAGGPDADGGVDVAIHGTYVVTIESQRAGWQLPDLFASGRARVVDESKVFGLLRDAAAAAWPSRRWDSGPDGPLSEALRAPCAPGARLERVQTHGRVDLPGGICETLRRELRRVIATRPAGEVVDRARHVLSLPWCRRSPARWDAAEVSQALERAHGGHGRAKSRLVEALAACPQSSGLLTVEGALAGRGVAAGGGPLALVVRPAAAASPVPCLAGPSGVGKTSLAVAAAAALGRPHVQVMLGGQDAWRLLHGTEDGGSGRIIAGLSEAGVNNPVFILEGIDGVDAEVAGVLLDVLDPQRRRAFDDAYIDVSFDLSAALWIVTATEPDRIPAPVRQWLRVIELSGYSVEEKVDIARRHLLTRPFAERSPSSWLSPEPPESAVEPEGCAKGPAVVSDVSASALGRPCAWVDCGGLRTASALHGTRGERPGRIVEELRRVGARNPVFVLDEVDRLDEAGGAASALLEVIDPLPGDCDPVPVAGTAGAARADDRPGRGHGRGDRGDHRRLYAGGGRVAAGRGAGRGVREGGAAAVRGGRGGGRSHAGEAVRDARRAPASGVGGGGRSHRAAGGRRRAVLHGGRDRRGVGHRSEPDGRLRGTDPDRRPGGSHAGVGAGRGVVAAGQRRALRHRPGLSSSHGHPPARGCRAGRWDVGRGDDGGGAGVGDDRARGARRRGAERRGHAVRPGASGRRHRGEAAGGAPLRAVRRHPAAGEPEASSCRGGTRGRWTRRWARSCAARSRCTT